MFNKERETHTEKDKKKKMYNVVDKDECAATRQATQFAQIVERC